MVVEPVSRSIELLSAKAHAYLQRLCVEIPSRRVGSPGNRAATELFAGVVQSFGFQVETPGFDCIDWTQEGATLAANGQRFDVLVSPYSLGCNVSAPLVVVSTVQELEAAGAGGKVLLMRGELAKGQLMPKNFPFYNPDEHQYIIGLLEARQPAAIVAATSRDPEMVGGGIYPFPIFEDGDFDIPSVYMTEEEGARLARHAHQAVKLESRARRIPSTGCNVIARKGASQVRRVALFAHIDSRMGTPGASDNASGTIVMLLLAELLADYAGGLGVELVAMNGEDYYCSPGEKQWLALNDGCFGEIVLGINVDDVGYVKGKVGYSLYGCPDDLAAVIRKALAGYPGIVEGDPWYQGDHGLFLMSQVPALALTSTELAELMAEITHTAKDTPEVVEPAKLVEVACALKDVLLQLDRQRS